MPRTVGPETVFQKLSSGGIFRLIESFQDLSLEDSQCWESMELSTESFKTWSYHLILHFFLGALALIWLFHDSYRWNRPKPWELSLKTYLSAFFPRALTLKWLFRESYRWNRPKPWELSLKTNPRRPKPWELSLKTNPQRPKPWELSLTTKPQRPSGRSSHGNGSPVTICRSSQNIKQISCDFSASKCGQFQY